MIENILVTNDDGIDARGIRALISVAQEFGNVTVVAPERGMSGMSHSITMYNPLFIRRVEQSDTLKEYGCDGTPVDCVKVAVDALMPEPPTLILSGINHGANTNLSVIYSGTMGAAMEGSTYGITSIGFSNISHDTSANLDGAIHWAREIIKMAIERRNGGEKGACLNVNVPNIPLSEIKGMKICRQTKGNWIEEFDKKADPRGREYFWLVGSFHNHEPNATDTDEWAISNNYVAVVPVQTDCTDYKVLDGWKNMQ